MLLGIIIAALLPHLVVKYVYEYYFSNDIQICREPEKIEYERFVESAAIEMLPISNIPPR